RELDAAYLVGGCHVAELDDAVRVAGGEEPGAVGGKPDPPDARLALGVGEGGDQVRGGRPGLRPGLRGQDGERVRGRGDGRALPGVEREGDRGGARRGRGRAPKPGGRG